MRTIRGILLLLGLLIRSRFRLKGEYWAWRRATALGSGDISAVEKRRALLEYARWLDRIRSISRL